MRSYLEFPLYCSDVIWFNHPLLFHVFLQLRTSICCRPLQPHTHSSSHIQRWCHGKNIMPATHFCSPFLVHFSPSSHFSFAKYLKSNFVQKDVSKIYVKIDLLFCGACHLLYFQKIYLTPLVILLLLHHLLFWFFQLRNAINVFLSLLVRLIDNTSPYLLLLSANNLKGFL